MGKQECDSAISICTYNPLTYDFSIKETITLGGTGCTTSIPTLTNTSFRASDFIQLNEGFNADNSTEMLLDVVPCQDDQHFDHRATLYQLPPPDSFRKRIFHTH